MKHFVDTNFSVIDITSVAHIKEIGTAADICREDCCQFVYVVKGTLSCPWAEDIKEECFFFAPQGCGGSLRAEVPVNAYAISFKAVCNRKEKCEEYAPALYKVKNPPAFKRLFIAVYEEYTRKAPCCLTKCKGWLYELILQVKKEHAALYRAQAITSRLSPAFAYIGSHYLTETIETANLARLCNMSEAYFRSVFKKVSGCTPKLYINSKKIAYAAELIEKKRCKTLAEAAAASGFNDLSYFSRMFVKINGVRPSVYMHSGD